MATLLYAGLDYTYIIIGLIVGGLIGLIMAKTVKMTAMPQMVGAFNGFGGAASALVATAEFLRISQGSGMMETDQGVSIMAGTLIGWLTFSGSMIAFAKLQGLVSGDAIQNPLVRFGAFLFAAAALGAAIYLIVTGADATVFYGLIAVSLVLGVLFVIPIGGADMPVVIALLNSYSGLAASAAGFVLENNALIISGALVGASGLILTNLMCKAMNRSLANVLFSAFGVGMESSSSGDDGDKVATSD